MPKRYRKKPVEIEAGYVRESNVEQVAEWCGGDYVSHDDHGNPGPFILIPTLGGTMLAKVGDYVIKGVAGEFYPCRYDIFVQTYEPVPDADS